MAFTVATREPNISDLPCLRRLPEAVILTGRKLVFDMETTDDRVKLIYHRLVAREIRRDPALIERARKIVEDLSTKPNQRSHVFEWKALLAQPSEKVRHFIVSRNQDATRLRITSPFPMLPELSVQDEQTRRRMWRKAKKHGRSTTLIAPSAR
ncbi:hypothetical protein VH569_18415 [Azospirillum sp. 11R-A]|uniref:hypothetical protein n=1 Tax=Azospirillum sp. 11R-A TaxID=3111634 RepID=UPI003C1B4714